MSYIKRTVSAVDYITFYYYNETIFCEVSKETSQKGKTVKEGYDDIYLSEDEKTYVKDKMKKALTEIFSLLDKIVSGSVQHDTGLVLSTSATVTAGAFVAGREYTIKTVGSTNFVALGASASTVGVSFVANGTGTGGSGVGDAYYTPFCSYANIIDNDIARDVTLQNIDEAIEEAVVSYILTEWYLLKGLVDEAKIKKAAYNEYLATINEKSVVLRIRV